MGEMGEWDSNIQVVVDKATIEVCKTEEGLNVFDLPRFRPSANNLDLVIGYCQVFSLQDIAKEFN
jgi:hypothetical protein